MSVFARSLYEVFVADYLSIKGYLVATDIRYHRLRGNRKVSTDLDILARPMAGEGKVIIGEVHPYSRSIMKEEDRKILVDLCEKLTEGAIEYKGERIGLGALLEQLGLAEEDVERCLFIWLITIGKDEFVREILEPKGIRLITFPEMFKELIELTGRKLKEKGWFEQPNYTQALLSMIMLLHEQSKLANEPDPLLEMLNILEQKQTEAP